MLVEHIIGIFSKEHGGPVVSLANYAMGQAGSGLKVRVRTLEGYPGVSSAVRLPSSVEQRVFNIGWPAKLGRSQPLKRFLESESDPDIYHLHGAWLLAMYYGQRQALRRQRPYLLELNGAYQPYELARKAFRKALTRVWFQDRIIHESSCLHLNSKREARQVRELGFKNPIVVIPAGFRSVDTATPTGTMKSIEPSILPDKERYFLYLARIHPNKGIDLLLKAWRSVEARHRDVKLMVVGAGDKRSIAWYKDLVHKLGLGARCKWIGFVEEAEKIRLYREAMFYCLPSRTENFGNTVQEALGCSCPVLTTMETPWLELEKERCGWLCECNEDSLGAVLEKALNTDDETKRMMGEAGAQYICREFSLASVINKQIATYKWLLGGNVPSSIVYTD